MNQLCMDFIRALPEYTGLIVAWCVFAPIVAVILTRVWFEWRYADGINQQLTFENIRRHTGGGKS